MVGRGRVEGFEPDRVCRLFTVANWLLAGGLEGVWRVRAYRGFGQPQEA